MGIRAVIIDDEEDSITVLKKLLKNFCPNVSVVGEANNIKDGYEVIFDEEPDVVFLDIQMPGGNGFSLIKRFDKIYFDIVFTTSYDKYALEAIKLSALHYLLKPIEVEDLQEAVKRVEKSLYGRELQKSQIENAIENIDGVQKKITVHATDKVLFLKLDEITHFESDRNYTIIFTSDHKKHTSSKNLGEYEEMLKDQMRFFRANKGCIVNLNHISHYTKEEPCIITINKQHEQEVSRRRKQEMLELLKFKG